MDSKTLMEWMLASPALISPDFIMPPRAPRARRELVEAEDADAEPMFIERPAFEPKMGLEEFIRTGAWQVLEPYVDLDWNWHITQTCEALELISLGQGEDAIRELAINVPPGSMKSLAVCVMWPAWEWHFAPWLQWLFATHTKDLALRDAMKMRALVSSAWYQTNFGDACRLNVGKGAVLTTTYGGWRRVTSVGSKVTGWRADRLVCDDLLAAAQARSPVIRESTNMWFLKEYSNRKNNEDTATVVIGQRLHELDIFYELQELGTYKWLVIPTRFDPDAFANDPKDKRDFLFEDERFEAGELLHPTRFSEESDEKERIKLGPTDYSCQHDQKATPPTGGTIKYEWQSRTWDVLPARGGVWYQSWDMRHGGDPNSASTSYAVGQLWLRPFDEPGRLYLIDQVRGKWSPTESMEMVHAMSKAPLWRNASEIVVEDKADGRTILDVFETKIPGLIRYKVGRASKDARWESVKGYWKAGCIILPSRHLPGVHEWIDDFRKEHFLGDGARNNDQIDTSTQMIRYVFVEVDREEREAERDGQTYDGWFD